MTYDTTQFYINGIWKDATNSEQLDVINPSTEKLIAPVSLCSPTQLEDAVSAARQALSTWSQTSKHERIGFLERLLEIYQSGSDEMAKTISEEMGAPISFCQELQVPVGAMHIAQFIESLKSNEQEISNSDWPAGNRVIIEPIGVVGLITPWNWPMNQIAIKVGAALAAGCTMILKPSENAPFSAMLFAEMMDQAGFPPGVFNLVNGDGPGVGTAMASHPDIAMISFTGSTRAGVSISKNAASSIKRVSLELGGKGANIIFADAAEDAVPQCISRCMMNSGQTCLAPTRMLVERSVYSDVIQAAKDFGESIAVGDPSRSGSHIGPVVSARQYSKIQEHIRMGIQEGATLLVGGLGKPKNFETGFFVRPTIFSDVESKMSIAKEEIFGPVLSIIPFDTEQQAVSIANDTPFGLQNYIQTQDLQRAKRIARSLKSGVVEINGHRKSAATPFGGFKQSGNGREGGKWGIDEFQEAKSVSGWF